MSEKSENIKTETPAETKLTECVYECPAEKRNKCLMFPEYCEGEKKEYIDLNKLCADALEKGVVR